MELAPSAGRAFFPLDEQLGLLPGQLAPRQQEHLVHLAAWMPFERAAELLADLLGVRVSAQTVRTCTETMAQGMQAAQDHEPVLQAPIGSGPDAPPARRVVSVDGAKISLVHQQWVEVRTLAIGEPEERLDPQGEREIHVAQLSYFSRLADAATFTRTAQGELDRRGVKQAVEVCLVTDGAEWCQNFLSVYRPNALRVLDFAHAAGHLSDLLQALEQAGVRLPPQCFLRCLHVLKHRGPRPLLRLADRLPPALQERKGIAEHLDYLRHREALMGYPRFQSQGWPIGSGMVESANKNVVQARLKGAGMHWCLSHVNPMLALRNAVCNQRWQDMWHQALLWRHQQGKRGDGAKGDQAREPRPCADRGDHGVPAPARLPHAGAGPERFPPPVKRPTTCPCGTPLLQKSTGAPRRYCSNACRQHAYEQRRALRSSTPPPPTEPPPEAAAQRRGPKRSEASLTRTCPCGTPLLQKPTGAPRRYCSNACRQRAYEQRRTACS